MAERPLFDRRLLKVTRESARMEETLTTAIFGFVGTSRGYYICVDVTTLKLNTKKCVGLLNRFSDVVRAFFALKYNYVC